MKQKQAIILFETILSIALFFIIISLVSGVLLNLQSKSKKSNEQSVMLLSLEATKQFLTNNKNLTELIYSNDTLFYGGDVLLKNVSKYIIGSNQSITTIDICINQNKVCTTWKIKN